MATPRRVAAVIPTATVRTAPTPAPDAASFSGNVALLDEATRASITPVLWRPGCPVPLEELRLLRVEHWGYDGEEHWGSAVVHRDYAEAVLSAMRRLWEARFPIGRMEPVNTYTGGDAAWAADNTTALNCRPVRGMSGGWSEHSYGRAIDINPGRNPYVSSDGRVLPPAAAPYADRSRAEPGMIRSGDAAVRAFEAIGWEWGGEWADPVDYQHFSATGR